MAHREVAVADDDVRDLARRLAQLTRARPGERLRRRLDVNEVLMNWAVARPEFKVPLFRFIDALPACRTDRAVLDHLDGYLDGPQSPALVRAGLHVAEAVPGGAHLASAVAHAGVRRMATRFIAGQTADDAARALEALWRDGFAATVDLLGEKTLTAADADHYAARVAAVLAALTQAATGWPEAPRQHSRFSGHDENSDAAVARSRSFERAHFEPPAARVFGSASSNHGSRQAKIGGRGA